MQKYAGLTQIRFYIFNKIGKKKKEFSGMWKIYWQCVTHLNLVYLLIGILEIYFFKANAERSLSDYGKITGMWLKSSVYWSKHKIAKIQRKVIFFSFIPVLLKQNINLYTAQVERLKIQTYKL